MEHEDGWIAGASVVRSWREGIIGGTPPTIWRPGDDATDCIESGPGLITLLGGAPGVGKTAFVMQLVFEALTSNPSLRVVIANVETAPSVLLDRQLARLAGLDAGDIRFRRVEASEQFQRGLESIEAVASRITFVTKPELAVIIKAADQCDAEMLVLDYVQRIKPPKEQTDRRAAIDEMMNMLRACALRGCGIFAISAVGRTRDATGSSSYSGLGLASFRESSELEFGADSAWLLAPSKGEGIVELRCVKNRHGDLPQRLLRFDGSRQRFTLGGDEPPAKKSRTRGPKATEEAAIEDLWGKGGKP